MGNFNPGKYNMIFCPVCEGKGKSLRRPHDFSVCDQCGGFGLVKRRTEQENASLLIEGEGERKPT